jgi:mRNA interferase MazF
MVMKQYDVCLINLDPTVGHEIQKTRPCVIISPDEMNTWLETLIIAPMTTKSHPYPSRIPIRFQNKEGWIVLDQIRAVDKRRAVKILGQLNAGETQAVKATLDEMLVK